MSPEAFLAAVQELAVEVAAQSDRLDRVEGRLSAVEAVIGR